MQHPQEIIDRLNAVLTDRYTVERRIGQGGMAAVYLARDLRHNREVAIKVLDREAGSRESNERFLREVQVAARLSHPHILPLHDSGVGDGILFYVMPYVPGDSLRARLRRERQLPLDDIARLTREVGEALTYAHERGVLHRDIKPENILLSGNSALVADFGIAKALSSAAAADAETGDVPTSTAVGMVIGTPAYMSPEQAFGESTLNGRSDVYSLACVTYEMITGEPPFAGATAQALLARHSSDPVPSLRTLRPTVSPAIEEVVKKGLAKSPADRYATPAEFAGALAKAISRPGDTQPLPALSRPISLRRKLAYGLAAAAVITGTFLISRSLPSGPTRVPMMVVLPFSYEGAPEQRFFADGLTDEITSRLARLNGLGVIARSGAATYVRGTKSLRDIAEELGVDYILEGTVRAEAGAEGLGSVRVIPSLTSIAENRVIWSEPQTVNLVPGSLFAVQGEIAENVAVSLDLRLAPADRAALRAEPTQNAEAYQEYLRGVALAALRYPAEPMLESIHHLQQAVALDPRFAQAWARLGVAHLSFFGTFDRSLARRDSARSAIARAVALAPDLPESQVADVYFQLQTELPDSATLRRVSAILDVRPNDSELLWLIGSANRRIGRWDDAVATYSRALRLNPRSQAILLDLGVTHMVLRNFPEAERHLGEARAIAPERALPWIYALMQTAIGTGDLDSTRAVFRSAAQRIGFVPFLVQMVRFPYMLGMLGGEIEDSLPRVPLASVPYDSISYYMAVANWHRSRGRTATAVATYDSARRIAERQDRLRPNDATVLSYLALATAGAGRAEEAAVLSDRAWTAIDRLGDQLLGPAYEQYVIEADILSGRFDVAIDRLERTMRRRAGTQSAKLMAVDPHLAPLRSNPRFRQLLQSSGASR